MNKMGTEDVTMPLSIYAVGFILAVYLMYVISFKDENITVGDLTGMILFGGFSWITVLICIIVYICANENKVIIKKKKPKKKQDFEAFMEEHKNEDNPWSL